MFFRWGILGPGGIAKKFATGLRALDDAQLVAVGSRSRDRANAFADAFDVPHRHASYEALARDSEVDAIYVATPHPFHKEHSILCLEAGKPVLCEKPFAINQHETREMIEVAQREGVFLMEAMWTRFLPPYPTGEGVGDRGRDWRGADAVRGFWVSRQYQSQRPFVRSRARRRRVARHWDLPPFLMRL